MADDNSNQMVKIAALGAAAFAGYKFVYLPMAHKRALQAEIERQTAANVQKGMGIEEAGAKAIGGACVAVAALYKIPPGTSGGICQGVGVLAAKSIKLTIKGAVIAGKVIGKGAAVIGKGIGKGGKAVGSAVKFASYTAPKKVLTTGASAVKFASYTAPKKVLTGGAKAVGKVLGVGSSKVGRGKNGKDVFPNDIRECRDRYGVSDVEGCSQYYNLKTRKWLWQEQPQNVVEGLSGLARRNPFADHAARRQTGGKSPAGRKRRSLAGISGAGPSRRGVAAFYLRHLR